MSITSLEYKTLCLNDEQISKGAFQVTTYNPETCPINELPCLEDVFERGYTIDDHRNKLEHVSIRIQPFVMPHALELILVNEGCNSISHVQRTALIYAVSIFENHPFIINMLNMSSHISIDCEDRETLCANSTINRLNFITPSTDAEGSISMLAWCKEWISRNCRKLGLKKTQLTTYLLIYGISRYTIKNNLLKEDIDLETQHFMKYLQARHNALSRI